MTFKFENATLHKYASKSQKGYEWLDQKWLHIHFLFLTKNDINFVLIFQLQIVMASVWPPEIPIAYHRWN